MALSSQAAKALGSDGLEDHTKLSGLREDILLLSWLIVLLRISEEAKVSCSWLHSGQDTSQARSLTIDREIVQGQTIAQQLQDIRTAIASGSISQSSSVNRQDLLLTATISETIQVTLRLQRQHQTLIIQPDTESSTAHNLYIDTLAYIISVCVASTGTRISHLLSVTSFDLGQLWSWNQSLPPLYQECMHDRISQIAANAGDDLAIHAWDGSLTYGEVEQYSSHTAYLLQQSGVTVGHVVPICFEKSRWTIVAILAVMKTGATFVLLDPALPIARLQNMAAQVAATIMLSSEAQETLASDILPSGQCIVLGSDIFQTDPQSYSPARIPTSAIMYIIFTSGSTGQPKGVKISFETYTSSAIPRAAAVGYHSRSRVLDFASYAFDVSIDSMLLTLGAGGCLCIPSDLDRMNDINGVMRSMMITYAGLTPSVARILEPNVVSSLEVLGLGGEAVSAREANIWGTSTRIVIGYGPCECTIGCTINGDAATGRDYVSIGPGNGAAMWIVDPEDHNTLMPLGAVGELLVEGPIVGQGYLNDADKTSAVFIEAPTWLVTGHDNYNGRQGKLYKTGDLGRFDTDGSSGIVFVGRKDTQVKLRGQRVELGEIESQLRALVPQVRDAVVEIIMPASASQAILVAFLAVAKATKHGISEILLIAPSQELSQTLHIINEELGKVLPVYMLPASYITIAEAPILISGKVDRKSLRQFGTTLDLQQMDHDHDEQRALSTIEQKLAQAWSVVLKPTIDLTPDSNFLVLGGDSVLAMRLISLCRSAGLELSVADIFANPTLATMADAAQAIAAEAVEDKPAFSLLSGDVTDDILYVATQCKVSVEAVKDLYPCTPIQQALFTFSMRFEEPYMAQRIAKIPTRVRVEAWKSAWEQVVQQHSILRTRLVQRCSGSLAQAELEDTIQWHSTDDLQRYLEQDRALTAGLGHRLARYAIVKDHSTGARYMVWSVHHLIYDGWSEPVILEDLCQALDIKPLTKSVPMQNFVSFLAEVGQNTMRDFWLQELKGATGQQFPILPHRDYVATQDTIIERTVTLPSQTTTGHTTAAVIRAAWAVVVSRHTGNSDVVFGETFSGRDIAMPGVESIIGPLIATVPVRVSFTPMTSVDQLLTSMQQKSAKRARYQHMGMQNIRMISEDAQIACETGTGLVVQPAMASTAPLSGFQSIDVVKETLNFNPYPLMLVCGLQEGGFRVCAGFDSTLIDSSHMEEMLAQLETACVNIIHNPTALVKDLSILPEAQLAALYELNSSAPLELKRGNSVVLTRGAVYPPATVSWVVDKDNHSLLLPFDCQGELLLESHILSDPTVEVSWLPLGKRGKLMATGDIVKLSRSGSIEYVCRKGDLGSGEAFVNSSQLKTQSSTCATLTVEQETLRKHWAALLKVDTSRIGLEDSFFRLGGDSVLAMKLAGSLRTDSFDLTVANVFRYMRLKQMAASMKRRQAKSAAKSVYAPFSSLEKVSKPEILKTIAHILPNTEIADVAPVTDSQELDLRATVNAPRTSVQYTVLYFKTELVRDRVARAWQQLIRHHEILRTVFVQHNGSYYQAVLKELDQSLVIEQASDELKSAVAAACLKDVHADYSLGSTFAKAFTIQAQGRTAFVLRLSHAQYDGMSLPALLKDLEQLYLDQTLPTTSSFCVHVAATQQNSIRKAAVAYWTSLLQASSPSLIQRSTALSTDKSVFRSQPIDLKNNVIDFTLATLLTTAWALVLTRHLDESDIIFGIVTSGLGNDELKLQDVNGPCYQLAPVRVRFQHDWTASQALEAVQMQSMASAPHNFLGHRTIAQQCTGWDKSQDVFGSIVHYQEDDGYESFDFAGMQCDANAIKPHGDAATPLKVVTYIEYGTTNIGLVGSELDVGILDHLLHELEQAIHDLCQVTQPLRLGKTLHEADSPLATN